MTTVSHRQAISLAAALARDKVGTSVLLKAITEAAEPGSEPTPEFKATDEQRDQRAQKIAGAKVLAITLRDGIRRAGPSGVRSGQFITDVILATGKPMGVVVLVLHALEIAGFIRLEGSNTLVSEEIDPPSRSEGGEAYIPKPLTLSDM